MSLSGYTMDWNILIWYALAALGGVVLGYAIGAQRSRKVKKRVLQKLNVQSLDLLDAKSSVNQLQTEAGKFERKERLLTFALTELKQTNKQLATLKADQISSDKRHFVELSRMRLHAVEARETARKAARIAKTATTHLRRIEQASPAMQTIEAHEPKSYGSGESVTVSVVDQARLDGSSPTIAQVSNRDSARLTKLHSSNEANAS